MELINPDAERRALQILWQEAQSFGHERAKELLDRTSLEADDFPSSETHRTLFAKYRAAAAGARAALVSSQEERDVIESADVLNPGELGAYADLLRDLTYRRGFKAAARRLNVAAEEPELGPTDLASRFRQEQELLAIRGDHWRPLTEAFDRVRTHIEGLMDGKRAPFVATGFDGIDEEIGGLAPTLVVIAAMPGVGKSAFIASILRNMAHRGEKAAVFSMEDEAEWLAFRLLAHETGVHQFVLRSRALHAMQWESVGNSWSTIPGLGGKILCDERQGLTPAEVLAAARAAILNHGARAVFLDNMTAMSFPRGQRRDLDIQEFLRECRSLASRYQVPVVVLSHVRRREDSDPSQMPRLDDCSESAAFEKLARLAFGLARDKKTQRLHVGVLKNTNGQAYLRFELELRPSSALVEAEIRKAKQEGLDL